MQMGASSKATILQHEAIHIVCKTDARIACLTSRPTFRTQGIRQRARRFLPCQLDEGWSSPKTNVLLENHVRAERRLFAYRSAHPEQALKIVCFCRLQISRPTPSRRLGYPVRRRCGKSHPLARSRGIHRLGALAVAKDSEGSHVAGRTHAKGKITWKSKLKEIDADLHERKMGAKRNAYPACDKRPSLHPILQFSWEKPPFGANVRWLPIGEVPKRPEASQALRRRATCR